MSRGRWPWPRQTHSKHLETGLSTFSPSAQVEILTPAKEITPTRPNNKMQARSVRHTPSPASARAVHRWSGPTPPASLLPGAPTLIGTHGCGLQSMEHGARTEHSPQLCTLAHVLALHVRILLTYLQP